MIAGNTEIDISFLLIVYSLYFPLVSIGRGRERWTDGGRDDGWMIDETIEYQFGSIFDSQKNLGRDLERFFRVGFPLNSEPSFLQSREKTEDGEGRGS